MLISLQYEKRDDGKILTAYVCLSREAIARTVEIDQGHCLVDESEDGAIVGVDFLVPEKIGHYAKIVAKEYENPAILESLSDIEILVSA